MLGSQLAELVVKGVVGAVAVRRATLVTHNAAQDEILAAGVGLANVVGAADKAGVIGRPEVDRVPDCRAFALVGCGIRGNGKCACQGCCGELGGLVWRAAFEGIQVEFAEATGEASVANTNET